ncbi:hypothetical protein IL252_08505 [Halomicrobium sp. IBSBa]|uniref:hypothetical protein n=1 Tax=Halomicrobium sp. IBSBa TaxID=2778916 RepID=UPI001ABF3BBC|nr:hypothetical protein [Halomicrobium sp. IBSBa]MBO4247852.1 hypothetical protein [Halomicrobium sp. IBSBa]
MVNTTKLLLGLTFALVLLIVDVLVSYFTGTLGDGVATFLIQALGTVATLLFVGATFLTVRQNRKTIQELRKDREKQVVIDELQYVIQPAIDRLAGNIEKLESGFVGWKPGAQAFPEHEQWEPDGGLSIQKPLSKTQTDEAALLRSKERHPELHSELASYDTTVEDLTAAVHDVVGTAGPDLTKKVERDVPRFDFSRGSMSVDPPRLLSYLLDGEGREYRDLHTGWSQLLEHHGDEFRGLLDEVALEERQHLRDEKSRTLAESRRLRADLIERRNTLQEEYGISVDEFTQENLVESAK